MRPAFPCQRGTLVAVEGITGVGKTYLTTQLWEQSASLASGAVMIEEFSRRPARGDLGHDLLNALITAARGDPFLRGGRPAAETLLLLAIKTYDYEAHCAPAMRHGQLVLEGRSLHGIAVYQSLILNPEDDEQAYDEMRAILEIAAQWRPMPDLTFLVADDVSAAIVRAERRDGTTFTSEERRLHLRVDALFERLAKDAPDAVIAIDRRQLSNENAIALMQARITERQRTLPCMNQAGRLGSPDSVPCANGCRLVGESSG
jgi:dTMP kinase